VLLDLCDVRDFCCSGAAALPGPAADFAGLLPPANFDTLFAAICALSAAIGLTGITMGTGGATGAAAAAAAGGDGGGSGGGGGDSEGGIGGGGGGGGMPPAPWMRAIKLAASSSSPSPIAIANMLSSFSITVSCGAEN
jgi:hypothetical protein